MSCLNLTIKYLILFQAIIQVTWYPCQALVEDDQKGPWKYNNRSFKLNMGNVYDKCSNFKKSIEKRDDIQYPNQEGHSNTELEDTNIHSLKSTEDNTRSDNNKFKNEKYFEEKGLLFTRHSSAYNKEKDKNRSMKKTHNKMSRKSNNNFKSIMDMFVKSKKSPPLGSKVESGVNFKKLLNKSNQEESNKRNERDIKTGKHNMNRIIFNNNHDGNIFSPYSSSEDNDQLYEYNNNIHENGQSSMILSDKNKQHWLRTQSTRLNSTEVGQENNYSKFDSKKLVRRAHESKFKGGESIAAEAPVEYKEERILCTTEAVITTTDKTDAAIPTKKNVSVLVTKSTPKISKYQLKKDEFEKDKISSETIITDLYEEFLSGQMADNFVNAVITKAQRSRKIWKELGFRNDSEETCDRCIETNLNIIPDLEAMKRQMKKFLKGNVSKDGYLECFRVPNVMEDFLNLLISFENEHEDSIYNKIHDDSSFIFTGDYPETLLKSENNMATHVDFVGDKGLFNKDSLEKQHIREENNDEKSYDKVQNINVLRDTKYKSFLKSNNDDEYITKSRVDERVEEEEEHVSKSMLRKHTKGKDDSDDRHSLQSNENIKGNDLVDVGLLETKDFMSPLRSKYNNPDQFGVYGDTFIPDRNKVYKNNKEQYLQRVNDNNRESDIKVKKASDQRGARNYAYQNPYESHYVEYPHFKEERRKNLLDSNIESKHVNKFQVNDNKQLNENDKLLSPNVRSGSVFNEHTNNGNSYYGYPPKRYVENKGFKSHKNKNIRDSLADDIISKDWENSEYQLYPNEPKINTEENSVNVMSRSKSYEDDDTGRQRIAEPYEDQIFFEVPDLEYDLY